MSDVSQRLLGVLLHLQSSEGRIRLCDLQQRFPEYASPSKESGRRKFERDKEALAKLGVQLEHRGHDEGYSYRLNVEGSFLCKPVDLDESEMLLLGGLAHEALENESVPYRSAMRVALSKLGVQPIVTDNLLIRHPVRDPDDVKDGLLDVAAEALLIRKVVTFSYRDAKGGLSEREVEPFGLFLKHGHWYLCGLCRKREDVRVFRLSRMGNLQRNDRAPGTPDFEVPGSFRLEDYSALDPVRFNVHERMTAEVRVDEAVEHLARAMWGEPSPDDPLLFVVETTNSDALVDQVLGLWQRAEILAPRELRAHVRESLIAVLEAHGASP